VTRFEGKAVLVTGAAQGIGRAIAERFLAEGAAVTIFDMDADLAAAAVAELGASGPVQAHAGDVAARADVQPILEISDDRWQRVLDVNLTGVFLCIQEGGRAIADAGKGGAIVVTASTNSFWVEQNMAPYNTSKAGEVALIRTAALDLAGYGIRVNGVAPGVVRTRISEWVIDDPVLGPEYLKKIPIGRFGEPGDVADAVAFLASADAGYITGQTLILDGGLTLGQPLEAMDIALPGADS